MIIVEDIIITGRTLKTARGWSGKTPPKHGVKVVTLLDKPERREEAIEAQIRWGSSS